MVLGFVVLSAALGGHHDGPSSGRFIDQLHAGQVRSAVINVHDHTVDVAPRGGQSYEVGYSPDYGSELIGRLRHRNARYDVVLGGRSWLISVLTYVLPFIIFIGFGSS